MTISKLNQAQQHSNHPSGMLHPTAQAPPPPQGVPPPPAGDAPGSSSSAGKKLQAPKPPQKYVKVTSLEQATALGVPIISPLHAPQKKIWLKQTTSPKSQLSNIARRNLYCDYLYLMGKVAIGKLGTPTNTSSSALKYDSKQLEDLYKCSPDTIQRIIKRGQTSDSTDCKPRPGRKRQREME